MGLRSYLGVVMMSVMSKIAALLLVTLCSCAGTLPLSHQRTMNRALLAVSTSLLVCDMGQTIPVAMNTPRDQPFEGNWLMGTHPSVGTLVGYNAAVVTANAAVYVALPERRRWLVPLLVTLVETAVIYDNAAHPHQQNVGRPWCGVR